MLLVMNYKQEGSKSFSPYGLFYTIPNDMYFSGTLAYLVHGK